MEGRNRQDFGRNHGSAYSYSGCAEDGVQGEACGDAQGAVFVLSKNVGKGRRLEWTPFEKRKEGREPLFFVKRY